MNYCPVSNPHFISKVLEKSVVKRLEQHIINHSLYDPLQSAYRVAHSTETAIIKIHNNIVNGIDNDQCSILAALDLSAAFDTVDHDIFIGRMHAYSIRETALKWFHSYLDRRSYRALINKTFFCSKRHNLQAVELSQWFQSAVQIVSNLPAPSNGGPIYRFLACRPCGPAGWLALLLTKAGDVETNPGPTTLNKKVWICDICHKQIHVRKQISIRCNRTEHWVHLRCAGIRQAQYTDTWTCHLHR